MVKKLFDSIKAELKWLGTMSIVFVILFQAIFYNGSFLVNLRMVISIFLLFILPGYCFMLYWKEKLDFTERFIIGTALAVGIIGMLSY